MDKSLVTTWRPTVRCNWCIWLDNSSTEPFPGSLFWEEKVNARKHTGGGGDVEGYEAAALCGGAQHGARLQGDAQQIPAGDGGDRPQPQSYQGHTVLFGQALLAQVKQRGWLWVCSLSRVQNLAQHAHEAAPDGLRAWYNGKLWSLD